MKMEIIQTTTIRLADIVPNRGQIEGLPANPRVIRGPKFEQLKKSIRENQELMALRELLVYKNGGKYVLIGGNMRMRAMKDLGFTEAPCKVIPEETTAEQLKAYTIKDNGSFGEWDFDALGNEWDVSQLGDWGVNVGITLQHEREVEEPPAVKFEEILNEEHNYIVLFFNNTVDWLQAQTLFDIPKVRRHSTSERDADENIFGKKTTVGRVMNGAEALENLRKSLQHENHD